MLYFSYITQQQVWRIAVLIQVLHPHQAKYMRHMYYLWRWFLTSIVSILLQSCPTKTGEFQILQVGPCTRIPISVDIGTFAILLSMYVLIKTYIKRVPITISDTDAGNRISYFKYILWLKRYWYIKKHQNWGFC